MATKVTPFCVVPAGSSDRAFNPLRMCVAIAILRPRLSLIADGLIYLTVGSSGRLLPGAKVVNGRVVIGDETLKSSIFVDEEGSLHIQVHLVKENFDSRKLVSLDMLPQAQRDMEDTIEAMPEDTELKPGQLWETEDLMGEYMDMELKSE